MSDSINTAAQSGNTNTGEAGTANTSAQEGQKTFTQEQVNAIVGERLSKEKTKLDTALADRERELMQRELMLTAKETITAKGLPLELLDALNISSPEALDKSITIIEKMKSQPPAIHGMKPGEARLPTDDTSKKTGDAIREAMGLKQGVF